MQRGYFNKTKISIKCVIFFEKRLDSNESLQMVRIDSNVKILFCRRNIMNGQIVEYSTNDDIWASSYSRSIGALYKWRQYFTNHHKDNTLSACTHFSIRARNVVTHLILCFTTKSNSSNNSNTFNRSTVVDPNSLFRNDKKEKNGSRKETTRSDSSRLNCASR